MNKVAIIGGTGWVGKAVHDLFPDAYIYTRHEGTKEEVNKCKIAYISVPTPLSQSGRLDVSIIEDIMSWVECPLVIIRSTVNPGDCDRWVEIYNKNIVFEPEYLGETPNHPLLNEREAKFIIIGGSPDNRRKIIELYTKVYNANLDIRQLSLYEAEIVKLSENRAIAFKVMQCHELYLACEKAGIDYYKIRDCVYGADPRFNLWFTFIYPENLGFSSSKCLRKDVPAWCAWARSIGFDPEITSKLFIKSADYAKL